ncbi:methyltransferase domain-containing protein [Actinomadura meridiana]|uniref:Protein-L-isoaspartate O-methyltransferase n=1 Tax=Actinomadura meridiana TaxID=559626 RepID=A0ABP8CKC5_9ACTN
MTGPGTTATEAAAHMASLANDLVLRGRITDERWREVFASTPRHVFTPEFYRRTDGPDGTVWRTVTAADTGWLDAVYADVTHVTALDPATVRPAPGGGVTGVPTSSSTLPSVMAIVLGHLGLDDGDTVLEIGTGTGYTTALLCERLGDAQVTSVDIDPGLVENARRRLTDAGYAPELAATDGVTGYPARAPYNRIMATCSVPAIPDAWIRQTRPGGLILADVRGGVGGALAALTVTGDGAAEGRFPADGAYFMPLRHDTVGYRDRPAPPPAPYDADTVDGRTSLDPMLLHDFAFGFVAQLHLPGVDIGHDTDDGAPATILTGTDGSTARITTDGAEWRVHQHGSRHLWSTVETAHAWWTGAGRPDWSRFGMTVTPTQQTIWLDTPAGPAWPLPPTP